MENLNMQRKTVSASAATEFKFNSACCAFLIKNMTDKPVYVSFGGLPDGTDKMLMIPASSWERHTCRKADGNLMSCTSVYVKGSGGAAEGSVEVKCLVW